MFVFTKSYSKNVSVSYNMQDERDGYSRKKRKLTYKIIKNSNSKLFANYGHYRLLSFIETIYLTEMAALNDLFENINMNTLSARTILTTESYGI